MSDDPLATDESARWGALLDCQSPAGVIGKAAAPARTGDAAAISVYLGGSEVYDPAIADWVEAYGDQTERDHAALVKAIETGRPTAVEGV
jgi:hypothetical protein